MKKKTIFILSLAGAFSGWYAWKAFCVYRSKEVNTISNKDIDLLLVYKQRQAHIANKLDTVLSRMDKTMLQVESDSNRIEKAYIDMFGQINEKLDNILNNLKKL